MSETGQGVNAMTVETLQISFLGSMHKLTVTSVPESEQITVEPLEYQVNTREMSGLVEMYLEKIQMRRHVDSSNFRLNQPFIYSGTSSRYTLDSDHYLYYANAETSLDTSGDGC